VMSCSFDLRPSGDGFISTLASFPKAPTTHLRSGFEIVRIL
jgi:hypothetical protein